MTGKCNAIEAAGLTSGNLDISIAILAGGKSLRFGSDKALSALAPGGPPLLQMVIDRLQSLTNDLFIVASERPDYARFALPVYPDRWAGTGPLGGIGTALSVARLDRCFVTSCDMPFLNPVLIRWMTAQPPAPIVAPVLPGTSRQGGNRVVQTLHAIYQRRCQAEIDRMLRDGERRVSALLDRTPVLFLDASDLADFDPEFWSFFSVNTPEALIRARKHWLSLQEKGQPQLY